jgi:expansin (peptidoglycan-binding protein)
MNSDGWTSVNCGQKLVITNDITGKTYTAKVADECPTCDEGSLDMSIALFEKLGGTRDEG